MKGAIAGPLQKQSIVQNSNGPKKDQQNLMQVERNIAEISSV